MGDLFNILGVYAICGLIVLASLQIAVALLFIEDKEEK